MNLITISGRVYTEGRVERLEDPSKKLSKAWMQIFDAEGKAAGIVPLLAWGSAEREGGAYEALAKVKEGEGIFVVGTLSTSTIEKEGGKYKEKVVEILVSQVTTLSEHQALIAGIAGTAQPNSAISSEFPDEPPAAAAAAPTKPDVTDEPNVETSAPAETPVRPRPGTRTAKAAASRSEQSAAASA